MGAFARRRRPKTPAVPTAVPTAEAGRAELEALAAAQGRPVDELLREVAEFRLALETDLVVAAAATELSEHVIAADALQASRNELAAYGDRLAAGLATIPQQRTSTRRRVRRALHSTPALVTALVLGAAAGFALPHLDTSRPGTFAGSARATQQLDELESATVSGDLERATSAGAALHATLTQLVDRARAGDVNAAHQAATLLIAERQVLNSLPPAVADPLRAQVNNLTNVLQSTVNTSLSVLATTNAPNKAGVLSTVPSAVVSLLPTKVPTKVPVAPSLAPQPSRDAKPSAKASPTAHTTPSPSPSASPSASASPSPSQSAIVLPGAPSGAVSQVGG
ncbi:MAG TPA: hypothetical protein VHE83_10550 [Mycobacteriales bacterium]|nr:hypothetical protein [Mycobacteriales bacterium]